MEGPKQNQAGTSPPSANSTPIEPAPNKLVANLKGETSDKKRGKSLSLTKQPSSKVEKRLNEKVPHKIDSKASLMGEKSKGSPLTPQPSSSKSEVNFPLGMRHCDCSILRSRINSNS